MLVVRTPPKSTTRARFEFVRLGFPAMAEPEAIDGIDRAGVEGWFREHVPGAEAPLSFELIAGGRSNLTYAVTDSNGSRWALRRPPLGKTLGSAHDMGRECRVVSALEPTDVPVAHIAGFCEDVEVNGAPFYVMDFVDGPILRRRADAEPYDEATRRAIGEWVVDTLVDIHAVDPDAVGLGELGKKQDYVARTIHRWQGQWEKGKTREIPLVDDLHDRLAARIPEQGPASIVHGDYRLDNMILEPGADAVAAVVDWELCTLGDPLADVGMLLVYWGEEGDELMPLLEPATIAPGFPSRDEVQRRYQERSGRDLGLIDFYVALGLWKLAIILEGVYARFSAGQYGAGTAEDDGVRAFGENVVRLAEAADEAERRLG
jgi:aminoglycoside phosphotransferase (APT) family kinase protein